MLDELARRASIEARRLRTIADTRDGEYAVHLVGVGWECLATQTESVLGARSPWAYVHRVMARAGAAEAAARDRLCSAGTVRHGAMSALPHTARRVDDAPALDAVAPVAADPTGDAAAATLDGGSIPERWDPALADLVEQLVSEGADRETTIEAVEGLLDIMQMTTSRSRVHTAAYRSQGLRQLLGHRQIQLLTDLLLGSRRDGPDGSAWLLLRRARSEGRTVRLTEAAEPFRRRASEFAATVSRSQPLPATA